MWRIWYSTAADKFLDEFIGILSSHVSKSGDDFGAIICDLVTIKKKFEFTLEASIVLVRAIVDSGGVEFNAV